MSSRCRAIPRPTSKLLCLGAAVSTILASMPGDAGGRKSHHLKQRACDGYREVSRGDVGHFSITTGSYGIPGASWVKFVVTGCCDRLSPRGAAEAASGETV